MSTVVRCIYVGRLVKEKGFDLILDMCEKVSQNNDLRKNIHLDIFGDGDLRKELEGQLGDWDFVSYHGHLPKEEVIKVWETSHYTLMPSRFLETFGLTALDSLSLGVPVVSFGKGGLSQFHVGGNQMNTLMKSHDIYEHIEHLINDFNKEGRAKLSVLSKGLSLEYTKETWIARFQELSGLEPGARVLLISDYTVDVGGIESYLLNVKDLLESNGYIVELIGCDDGRKARYRFLQLFGTIWNMEAERLLTRKLQSFKPDLIWWHSIQRRRGPLPLRSAKPGRGKQWIMYHDFGLFHPYPSRVENENQVREASSLVGFLKQSLVDRNTLLGILLLPLVFAKRCSSLLIKKRLEYGIDLHLVPSAYMEKLVEQQYDKKVEVKTLSHFG